MKPDEKQNRFAALELSDEDFEFVSGGEPSGTTVTCPTGTKAHIKTGTTSSGQQTVTVKCF
jgi:hypothetical protein